MELPARIGVVGSSNVDLVTYVERMPVWGETISAPRFEMNMGGKGANQAVAAAKLGASVVLVSKVGNDSLGEGVLRNLESVGVDTTHIRRIAGQSTGTATILVNVKGENLILIVKGANGDLTPADVEAAGDDLKACNLILLQLEVPLDTVYAALAVGKRHGVKTALNPAPAVRGLDMEYLRLASFLTPNETELAILTGMPVESEDEIAAAAKSLIAQGIENGHRHARRARGVARHGARSQAHRAGQGRSGRTRLAPATLSSGPSPDTSAQGFPSRRRLTERHSTRPIPSQNAARRSPLRLKPSSTRSAIVSGQLHEKYRCIYSSAYRRNYCYLSCIIRY